MNLLTNSLYNNIENNNEIIEEKEQTKFIESNLGKTINIGLEIGLRALLPDYIEQQVIDIKDTLLNEGMKDGIKKVVSSAIDIGKSAIGIITGKFENINQVQTAIKNGGIIDGMSKLIDAVLYRTQNSKKISYNLANTIRKGKNVILDSVSNKIEQEYTNQLASLEKVQKYSENWKEYFNSKNFNGMEKEYKKLKEKLKELIPTENTLKEARIIENLHTIIKNNGQNFDLSEEQLKLAEILI